MSADWSKRLFSRDGWPLWLVLLAGLILLAAGLGLRSPWPADEPRFVLIAREMLATHNWLFPHRAGQLYPDKPPVFFWALAFSLWITGGTIKVAHLLPALLSGLSCLAMVYDLGRRLYNRRVATAAALLLLFCIQFTSEMRGSQIDGFLCLWTTLGLYGMCRHLLLGPSWGFYTLAGFAMGIGIITKGVGFLPLLILIPYILMKLQGSWGGLSVINGKPWQWALVLLAIVAAVAIWLVPMLYTVAHSTDPALVAYRDNILFKQTAGRYSNPWAHFHPFWYYFVSVIPTLWFPLSVLLVWLVPAWLRRIRLRDARVVLPLAWAILVVLFFSLSHGKRGVYVLPALPGVILAAAPLLPRILNRRSVRYTAFALTLALGLLVLAALAYLGLLDAGKVRELTRDIPNANLWPPLIVLGFVFVLAAAWARPRRGIMGLVIGLTGLWFLYGLWVAPAINPSLSGQRTMAAVQQKLPANAELAMVNWKSRLVLYAKRPVTQFGFHTPAARQVEDASAWLLQVPSNRWVLTDGDGFKPCFDRSRAIAVTHGHDRHWYLLNAQAIVANPPAECSRPAPQQYWISAAP